MSLEWLQHRKVYTPTSHPSAITSACHSASFTTKVSMVAMMVDDPVMTPRKMAWEPAGTFGHFGDSDLRSQGASNKWFLLFLVDFLGLLMGLYWFTLGRSIVDWAKLDEHRRASCFINNLGLNREIINNE